MLDDASSSPNDRSVSSVQRLRRLAGFSRIVLADDSWFPLSTETVKNLGITPGFFFSPSELDELRGSGWRSYAYHLGLDLLGRSEASAFGMRRKFLQRKIPSDAAEQAIQALLSEGSIDDRRYADAWIRAQLRKKAVSRRALVAGLRRRGVGRHDAEGAVAAAFEQEPELQEELFRRAVEQVQRRRNSTPERAVQALLRRGFSTERVSRWYQAEQSKQSQQRD